MLLTQPLTGITVPLVTPLTDHSGLDTSALGRLCEHVLRGGVEALFVLGTTGEGPGLAAPVRRDVVRIACEYAAQRAPILVGLTDSSPAEVMSLSEDAARAGAGALVYAGPPYYPVSQAELVDLVGRMVERLPLPLFLYNMPSHTHVTFEPDTVRQLCGVPRIVGLKDSSANLIYFQRVRGAIAGRVDFGLLMGPEELLGAAMLAGATGGVNGGSNLFPSLYVSLYRAARAGDWSSVERLQQIVLRVSSGVYGVGTYSSSYLKGLKCALSVAGLCGGAMMEPYVAWGADQRRRIKAAMEELRRDFPEYCAWG
jgi:dihydrodipicolinate synthase/N-acetylneuraminate lyase